VRACTVQFAEGNDVNMRVGTLAMQLGACRFSLNHAPTDTVIAAVLTTMYIQPIFCQITSYLHSSTGNTFLSSEGHAGRLWVPPPKGNERSLAEVTASRAWSGPVTSI